MSEEQPKKVVRRVVKKTVVRPVSDVGREERPRVASPGRSGTPRTRTVTNPHTGRTVTLGGTPGASADAPVVDRERSTSKRSTKRATKPVAPVTPRRSPRDVLDDWRLATSERTVGAARSVRSGAGALGTGARSGGRRVLSVRLPHWPDVRGVLVTALVTGLVVVGLGAATLALFKQLFGVKSGAAWGVLAFAVIALVAFAVSRTVLRWFGHPSATAIAGLAQLIGIVLLLILLPTSAQSLWSLLIVPSVAIASHLAGYGGVRLAEAEERGADDDEPAPADTVSAT
ncbi:hypothetical protein [Aeromicrobium alkaliterrae]|uniref:Uncharacterized protein n=1 Tax=Aeromicrobium alkaliterrae TaxID=302168 RepID=A0ABP4WA49_9ACTN